MLFSAALDDRDSLGWGSGPVFPVLADVLAKKKDNKFNARAHASATGGPPAMASNTPSDFIFLMFSG